MKSNRVMTYYLELSEHFDESWPCDPRSEFEVASELQHGGRKLQHGEMTWTLWKKYEHYRLSMKCSGSQLFVVFDLLKSPTTTLRHSDANY